ncbi:MAG: hypothetical protein ACK50A_16975 [Sphingobacteriaceae bacterium]
MATILSKSYFSGLTIHFTVLFPALVLSQTKPLTNKTELQNIYTQAISDFIKAAEQKNAKTFDTLFINKRKQNDEDDFPNIVLPNTISNTPIVLDNFDVHLDLYRKLKHLMNLNMIGWVQQEKAEFMFVMFTNGFEHQYDYNIKYNHNKKTKKYEVASIKYFEQPSFQKK